MGPEEVESGWVEESGTWQVRRMLRPASWRHVCGVVAPGLVRVLDGGKGGAQAGSLVIQKEGRCHVTCHVEEGQKVSKNEKLRIRLGQE